MHNIYQFEAKSLQGRDLFLNEFKGKTVLIVNTASNCGFTPQLEGLQALYEKYREKDFVILGFPCNQFANQEPGNDSQIAAGCVVNYGVTFPMFSKIEVNGQNAHPLYKYLKKSLPGWFGGRINWNFTKFLINKEGKPVKRFAPMTKPDKIEKYIQATL